MADAVIASPPRAGSLIVLLRFCESRIQEQVQPALDAAGISPEHWRIMALLAEQPGLGMNAIASGAVLPGASATRHVDRLVELGLVVRRIDPTDRRRVVTALSPRGRRTAERIQAVERMVEERIAAELGARRFQQLTRDLGLVPHVLD